MVYSQLDGYLGNGIVLKSVSSVLKVVDDDYIQLETKTATA